MRTERQARHDFLTGKGMRLDGRFEGLPVNSRDGMSLPTYRAAMVQNVKAQ